jgi:hypothetical protein
MRRRAGAERIEQTNMNARQAKFVAEYLACKNGAEAYRRAGYKAKTDKAAGDSASRLLENVGIATAIKEGLEAQEKAQQERAAMYEVTKDWVVENLKEVAARAMQKAKVLGNDGKEAGYAEYNGPVACRSLELLGKSIGMFKEVHEHGGKNGTPITIVEIVRPGGAIPIAASAVQGVDLGSIDRP